MARSNLATADAPEERQQADAPDPSKSADVVMVGCKLAHGLVLEIVEPGQLQQPLPAGKRYTLKGANSCRIDRRAAQGEFPCAYTPIPRDFWDAWLARNKGLEFVVKGFVFAEENAKDAKAHGKEMLGEKTGMEALATEKDPRIVKGTRVGASTVETDEEALARALEAST